MVQESTDFPHVFWGEHSDHDDFVPILRILTSPIDPMAPLALRSAGSPLDRRPSDRQTKRRLFVPLAPTATPALPAPDFAGLKARMRPCSEQGFPDSCDSPQGLGGSQAKTTATGSTRAGHPGRPWRRPRADTAHKPLEFREMRRGGHRPYHSVGPRPSASKATW